MLILVQNCALSRCLFLWSQSSVGPLNVHNGKCIDFYFKTYLFIKETLMLFLPVFLAVLAQVWNGEVTTLNARTIDCTANVEL